MDRLTEEQIRALWRVHRGAAQQVFYRRAVYEIAVRPPLGEVEPSSAPISEAEATGYRLQFVHEIVPGFHIDGTPWRVMCEGIVIESGRYPPGKI